ncbi:MAG: molybdate ABC transporter substrate-binding protein, partial [Lysobacteraceae bacterium]
MSMTRALLFICAMLLSALAPAAVAADAPAPLTVFAAASLKESMDAAAAAYETATGQAVRVSYAASSALARQIEQGAPADVIVSADRDWMDYLHRRRLIDTASRRDLLGNSLVMVAPRAANPAPIALRPGADLLPRLGSKGRLALALTASVPAGKYAKASFTSLGMWPALQARVA